MKFILAFFIWLLFSASSFAQKQMLSYPFEFEKGFMQKSDFDSYFLDDSEASNFAFILKDNKKVEYVLVDKNFKVVSKISAKIDETIFRLKETYVGGTAKNGVFNFVYKISRPGYQVETVDFNNKTIVNKQIFEIPREEKLLTSFSDNNVYYNITANNKTSELVFYILTEKGESIIKKIPFKIPETKNKDKNQSKPA